MQAETHAITQPGVHPSSKPAHLKKAREFQRVRQQGRSVSTGLLAMGWAANDLPVCRCGYAVGKRVGGAVVRNRVKRRLREITRLQIKAGHIPTGCDVVWIARTGAAQASYQQLATDALHLLRRAHLWRAAPPEGTGSL